MKHWISFSGIGYDVHRMVDGRPCILGGVRIEHPSGPDGHSDADVLCHAVADAVLGAAGLPDIGHYFPPGDPGCAGISSLEILRRVAAEATAAGSVLVQVDATLIAEAPKIRPYVGAMKVAVGGALGIDPERVGIKATTNEGLGFLGRREGIAAMAVATLARQLVIPT